MALATNGVAPADRGANPGSWVHVTTRPTINMAWHHTIPWNCLRSIWNSLVCSGHWDGVDEFMQLCGCGNIASRIAAMKANTLPANDRDDIHTAITWQGWNIVEGPETPFRNDDPGENFDAHSGTGMSDNQKSTHLAITALFTSLSPIAATDRTGAGRNNLTSTEKATITKAIRTAKTTLRGKDKIAWTVDMWDKVQDGRPHPSQPVNWSTPPVYRKAP